MTEYTPEWAEGICDVPADTIVEIAESRSPPPHRYLRYRAPSLAVAFGCAYQNSFRDGSRGVHLLNALLGCWGRRAGCHHLFAQGGRRGSVKFPRCHPNWPPSVWATPVPAALSGTGTNLAIAERLRRRRHPGVFFYSSNAVQGYAQPASGARRFPRQNMVTIDVQMSETALASDYVLPECTVLERLELPEFIGGRNTMCLRTPIIERIHPETRPCDGGSSPP